MASASRFSKDPLVFQLSMRDFIKKYPDFFSAKSNRLDDFERPLPYSNYYFYDATKIGIVYFDGKGVNYGMDVVEKLGFIEVAYRDGTELRSLDQRIKNRERKYALNPDDKHIKNEISRLKRLRKNLSCKGMRPKPHTKARFEDCVVDTGVRSKWSYPGNYVVLDLETNGLRWSKDDLLSISIYSPETGLCYNRFLPLDQQPLALTGWINHIRSEDLEGKEHLTQEEFDRVMTEFHLDQVTVLVYSGGDGSFDLNFLANYCKRHGITGYEKLKIQNIKTLVPIPGYGTEGQCTKDNLCRLLGIEGVSDFHTGLNDCILEWRLFDSLMTRKVFFVDNQLVEYVDDYVAPISYILKHPKIAEYAGIKPPRVYAEVEEVFSYVFPPELIGRIMKFSTNITGITVENAINALVDAKRQDNRGFLRQNRMKLKYLGSLDKNITTIPLIAQDDGTVKTSEPQFEAEVELINGATKAIMEGLSDTVRFLNEAVFLGEKVMSQEMVLSEKGKVLALCDLSSKSAVVEIKTCDIFSHLTLNGKVHLKPEVAYQLHYEAKGRRTYVLSIEFRQHDGWTSEHSFYRTISALNLRIYRVCFSTQERAMQATDRLNPRYKPYFDEMRKNPCCTYKSLQATIGFSKTAVQSDIACLREWGYIEHCGNKFNGEWRILIDPKFWD